MKKLLLLTLLLPAVAMAHRFAPSLLEVRQMTDTRFAVTWKTPIEAVSDVALTPRLPDHCIQIQQSPWVTQGTGKLQQSVWECADGLVSQSLGVSGLDANRGSALLTVQLDEGIAHQAVLTADTPALRVPEEPDASRVVWRYTILGVEHIWLGIDHLLFVLGLLLLVGGGRRLVWTITAFTLGHSATLAMVTLGWFTYPVALIEFLIAVSIFVLSAELTRQRGISALWQQPWWLAGGFGLLHGMGFAGALAETGLPAANVPLALLFFNIGIELGQLAFIAVLLVLGGWLQRVIPQHTSSLARVPVVVLGILSAMWCVERGIAVIG